MKKKSSDKPEGRTGFKESSAVSNFGQNARKRTVAGVPGAVLVIILAALSAGCNNPTIQTIPVPLALSNPQDSFVLGQASYSIRFNQNIAAADLETLKGGIFLRIGDENAPEVNPESAETVGSVIRISLPGLKTGQTVRTRIAAGTILANLTIVQYSSPSWCIGIFS